MASRPMCYNCGNEEYKIEEFDAPALYDEDGQPLEDGPTYKYMDTYCPNCDCMMYVESVEKENTERRRNVIRDYYGIISMKDLLRIPKKYAVSREKIDEILNFETELWGKETCASVWDGEPLMPDESDRARKALESPTYFMERLESAKDNFPKKWYDRTHKRIEKMVAKEKRIKGE